MRRFGGAPLGAALALSLLASGCGRYWKSDVDRIQEKVDKDPSKAEHWVELAKALDAAGKEEAAMYAFSAAFDRHTKDVTAYRRAAEIAGSFGLFQQARIWADLGLWAKEGDRECIELVARALISSGTPRDLRRAEKHLEKLGVQSVPPFSVSRDRALLRKLRASAKTPNFEVRTDGGGAYARDVATMAQRIFDRYRQLMPGLKPPPTRIRVFVFESKADYSEILAKHAARFSMSEGLTILDPAGIRVILSNEPTHSEGVVGGAEWMDRLLLHELTHVALFLGTRGQAPLWLQEGLAEYFSGADPMNANFSVGGRLIRRVEELQYLQRRGIGLPSLSSLFYGYSAQEGLYAHAWSFVRFLAENHRDRFREMLKLAATGKGRSAFDEAFAGVDRSRLEAEWHAYARSL